MLAFPSCPNRDAAIALAERVCQELDGDAEIQVLDVEDQQAAERIRCLGSPTIRIDGLDVEPGADQHAGYTHTCRLYPGEQSLRGLPDERWVREGLRAAQARRELGPGAIAAEAAAYLDQIAAGREIGARLNHLLFGFVATEVLPQANRAAELGIDPTPWLEVVITVLRMYADALQRPDDDTD
ncbi:MAG TPA: hypothetical protein VFQ68_23870 [Streptosporangiaceae bacterium]|nr:hypothetical protein [Streptosporangiaceae bacterium]